MMAEAAPDGSYIEFNSIEVLQDRIDREHMRLREARRQHREDPQAQHYFNPVTVLNPEPGMMYRGVVNRPRALADKRAKGYVTVTKEEKACWPIQHEEDGLKIHNDVVLMKKPIDAYVRDRARIAADADARSDNEMNSVKDRMERIWRDEGKGDPHRSGVIDNSKLGEEQVANIVRPKK
jgi:hypothetical protein